LKREVPAKNPLFSTGIATSALSNLTRKPLKKDFSPEVVKKNYQFQLKLKLLELNLYPSRKNVNGLSIQFCFFYLCYEI
jgi:hypothetical protein